MTKDHVVASLKQTIDTAPADCTVPNFSDPNTPHDAPGIPRTSNGCLYANCEDVDGERFIFVRHREGVPTHRTTTHGPRYPLAGIALDAVAADFMQVHAETCEAQPVLPPSNPLPAPPQRLRREGL